MIQKKRGLFLSVCVSIVFLFFTFLVSAESAEIANVLLKLSLHQGESVDRVISISSETGGVFTVNFHSLEGVSINEESILLNAGETREVTVHFDARSLEPGIYVGSLSVENDKEQSSIPIVLEVESVDLLFDLNLDIPPQFKDIAVTDTLLSQVKLFDLTSLGTNQGLGPSSVDLDLFIYDLNGRLITSQTENVVVDRQTQLTKTFSFPSTLPLGDYVLAARASYRGSVGTSSSLFSLIEKKNDSLLSSSGSSLLFIALGVIGFFVIFFVLLFLYFTHDRNKLILELRAQQETEAKELHRFLLAQEKLLKAKGARPERLRAEIHRNLAVLKKKHAQREKEMRTLQKKGASREMQTKLNEWKRKGYDTHLLEYKLKGLTSREMSSLLVDWKKKYHAEGYKK